MKNHNKYEKVRLNSIPPSGSFGEHYRTGSRMNIRPLSLIKRIGNKAVKCYFLARHNFNHEFTAAVVACTGLAQY